MRRLDRRGDTIVEVLIAIVVVSVILTGAFVSARRSQSGIRQTQERVEALKVAEGQMERIRVAAKSGAGAAVYTTPHTFCVAGNDNAKVSAGTLPQLSTDNFANVSVHPAECSSTPTGVTFHTVTQLDPSDNTFTVTTRWDGVGGIGKQEVQLFARIHP
ncbi:prepilin-type N-terminal cleavage/methylation domain-containing protein [Patescibacteria group bacterium]|nr:MAG: prepilin-type N-terminal cleavage/methylation domain-containing protein [Patescibacteria group bacterium]